MVALLVTWTHKTKSKKLKSSCKFSANFSRLLAIANNSAPQCQYSSKIKSKSRRQQQSILALREKFIETFLESFSLAANFKEASRTPEAL
jgi:hypothetical protein